MKHDSYQKKHNHLLLYVIVLAGLALTAHGTGLWNDFIAYDDSVYIYENASVRQGITLETLGWALRSFTNGNWHPLTWVSHMLVVEVANLDPFWHHLLNLLLHGLNVALFFLLLHRMTGAVWRSAIAAALFAVHPLHVESVAWIAERKDVLSMCCGLLSLHAYARYAETLSRRWHTSSFLFLGLGLMAKPMLVTLPVLFFLLDFWPLRRIRFGGGSGFASRHTELVREKIPFFILAGCASALAILAQQETGALAPLDDYSIWQRLANVATSYVAYCDKLLWPVDLAPLYPLPAGIAVWKSVLSALALCALTGLILARARRAPYCVTGWLWYLVAMLPMIGLVQVGVQSMADRYTYLPFLGLYMGAVWGCGDIVLHFQSRKGSMIVLTLLVAAIIGALTLTTRRQTELWSNTISLFEHTVAVTENNFVAHRILAKAYADKGEHGKAVNQLEIALDIRPKEEYSYWLLAKELLTAGRGQEALSVLEGALAQFPNDARLYNLLGVLYYRGGDMQKARKAFALAVLLEPRDKEAASNLFALERTLSSRPAAGEFNNGEQKQ